MRNILCRVLLATGLALPACALGPHELLVLANGNSTASVDVAKSYARLRQVPDCNLVLLDLPPAASASPYEISTNDFTTLIWEPAQRAVRERGIDDHILAWAYSIDMPVRITTDPRVSLTGLTFVRNRLPPKEAVARGLYGSALFAGPDGPTVQGFPSQSLDNQRAWMGNDMPIPAMMLGFAGDRGNTRAEIDACLQRGAASDGTLPAGTVYLITNSDIRTRCRMWQFPAVVGELREAHVPAVITDTLPADIRPITGVLHGLASLDLGAARTFVPGCMAEHLTSFGAVFDTADQTKLTAWLHAGATASGGTITEPMAIWTKFPHARYFVHAAAGATVMESFYLSVKCPLQFLPVGEPLAAPWRPAARLTLNGLAEGPLRAPATVSTSIRCEAGSTFNRTMFLLDGRTLQAAGKTATVTLSPAGLTPGAHTLRAVAYALGPMRHQVFAEATFFVE
jgi:uncharacterized protein (TIGR03790 family)